MDILQTATLAITQGITELLPVSSSGHLIIISDILNIQDSSIFLLTTLHLGTSLAILLFFWKRIFELLKSLNKQFIINIIVATIPAVIAGLLLQNTMENLLNAPTIITNIIAFNLVIWGVVMIILENLKIKNNPVKKIEDIKIHQALVMGVMQMLALIPGTSRSGITTIGGIISGVEKYTALEFSFILGLPILFGSFFYEVILSKESLATILDTNYILAIVLAFIVGYLSISLLEKFSKKKFLTFFGVYRIILGLLLFAF